MTLLRPLCLSALLACCASSALAVTPPKYLAVKDFKQCLAEQQHGSYTTWCLPPKRAKACPRASWKQLRGLKGEDALPPCTPVATQ